MSQNNAKQFYLTVKGEKVAVTEEVYRAYVRPVRAEQRQKRREWKCRLLSTTGGFYVRCNKQCEECPYYLSGKNALGNNLSLDQMADDGVDIEDRDQDLEAHYMEEDSLCEDYGKLHKAIAILTDRQKEFVKLIYFEGKTQEEVARLFSVDKSAVSHAMGRIYQQLKNFFEKY